MKKTSLVFAVLSLVLVLAVPVGTVAQTSDQATIVALQAQIAALLAQVQQLQTQLASQGGGTTAAFCHTFNKNLKIEDEGDEVLALQTILGKEGLEVRGDAGFGERTASAVVALQEKYAAEILDPVGLEHGTGYVGRSTRAKLNKVYGCAQNVKNTPVQQPAISIIETTPIPPSKNNFCTVEFPSTSSDLAAHNQPRLFNINFGVSIPEISPSDPRYTEIGSAVVGSPGDYWNVTGVPWCDDHTKSHLKNADNSESSITVEMKNLGGFWRTSASLNAGYITSDKVVGLVKDDTMLDGFNYPAGNKGGNSGVVLYNVPSGSYDLYIYNKTANPDQYGDYTVTVDGREYGRKILTADQGSERAARWEEGNQYVKFTIDVQNGGGKVQILIQPHKGALHDAQIGGLQLAPAGTPTVSPVVVYQPQQQTGATEQVKCVFSGSTTEQKCGGTGSYYTTSSGMEIIPPFFECRGVGSCVAEVRGPVGMKVTWSSSCPESKVPVTTIDGNNEYANFSCSVTGNQPPVISGIDAPTTLAVGQQGTWTVRASDPENSSLSYSVTWGDEGVYGTTANAPSNSAFTQTATFTHSYSAAGVYSPRFTVRDNAGQSAQTSASVQVGVVPPSLPFIRIISPNGGEAYGNDGGQIAVNWYTSNVPSDFKFDVVRLRGYPNGGEYILATNVLNDGQEVIAIPSNVPVGAYTLEIKSYLNNVLVFDSSDSYFKIYSNSTQPSITVLSPNGGESWQKGTTQTIQWQDLTKNPTFAPISYDLKLVPYNLPCTGQICPAYIIAPYTIAKSVSGSLYSWKVGSVRATWCLSPIDDASCPQSDVVPDGSYTVQVCQSGTSTCDSSDSYFKIYSGTSINHPPEIVGIPAVPTNIQAGQTVSFSWNAKDADNDDLNWSIEWGDGSGQGSANTGCGNFGKGWNFASSHAWANPGTYKIVATVSDCLRATATSVQEVTVGVGTGQLITVLRPNGGESWQKLTTQTISWQDLTKNPTFAPIYYDLKLVPYYPPCTTNICPAYVIQPYTIAKGVFGSSYSWKVGSIAQFFPSDTTSQNSTISTPIAPDGSYTIQVCQSGTTTCDSSDSYFKIYSATTQPSITVLSPNGGETWQESSTYTINWKALNLPSDAKVGITLFRADNANKNIVSGLSPNATNYSWTVNTIGDWGFGMQSLPAKFARLLGIKTVYADSGQYTIMISAHWTSGSVFGNAYDRSDAPFTIISATTTATSTTQSASLIQTANALNSIQAIIDQLKAILAQ